MSAAASATAAPPQPAAAQTRLRPQLLAEFIGTAALFCAVIGSGIMAET